MDGINWLDSNQSGYVHRKHIHGTHDFGYEMDSKSHIESLWFQLKILIKKIYNTIHGINFNLFLLEAELRLLMSNNNDFKKMNRIQNIFEYISDTTSDFNLYDVNKLDNP